MSYKFIAAVVGLALGGATVVIAATPIDVITARQENFKQIGKANKGIMDELKTGAPNAASVQANATTLADLSSKMLRWFPKGTGPETGAKTAALPAIWERDADFHKAAVDFNKAARALRAAARSGDAAKISAAAPAIGAACKGCHESFRARK